jgi:hypothetical protein
VFVFDLPEIALVIARAGGQNNGAKKADNASKKWNVNVLLRACFRPTAFITLGRVAEGLLRRCSPRRQSLRSTGGCALRTNESMTIRDDRMVACEAPLPSGLLGAIRMLQGLT